MVVIMIWFWCLNKQCTNFEIMIVKLCRNDGHVSVSNTSQLAKKTCCTGGKYSVTSESDSMAR